MDGIWYKLAVAVDDRHIKTFEPEDLDLAIDLMEDLDGKNPGKVVNVTILTCTENDTDCGHNYFLDDSDRLLGAGYGIIARRVQEQLDKMEA